MARFGWTRLAQFVITLVVLAFVIKLGPLAASAVTGNNVNSSFSLAQGEATTTETTKATTSGDLGDQETRNLQTTTIPTQETGEPEIGEPEGGESGGGDHAGHDHTATSGLYENVDFEGEAPVFYRPVEEAGRAVASRRSSPASGGSGQRVCKNVSAAPAGARIVFPLTREHFDSYEDTWGAARPQGGHEGTDLMVPDGTPLLAMTDATVVPVSGANENGWNSLGGYTAMLRADTSIGPVEDGDLFYYAHMNRPANLEIGEKVEVGDVIGYVGDTGEGPEGTSGRFPPHLHLGWYDVDSERSQVASGAMNPYPLLEWIKANGGSIEGGSDIPYCEAPQPANPTPSGGGSWQYPTDPGVRPDMDTGTQNAAPTPAARPAPSAESPPSVTPDVTPNEESNRPERNRKNNANERGAADRANNIRDIVQERLDERIGDAKADSDANASVGGGSASVKPDRNAQRDDEPGKNENDEAAENDAPNGGDPREAEPSEEPNGNAGNASPFRDFPSLTRAEKIQSLLRLERLGVNISRFEKWLERALEAGEPQPDNPENTENPETTEPTEDPEIPGASGGEADEETTDDEICEDAEISCKDASDTKENGNEDEDKYETTTEDSSSQESENSRTSGETTNDAPLTEATEDSSTKPVDDATGDVSSDDDSAPEMPATDSSETDMRVEDPGTEEIVPEATTQD